MKSFNLILAFLFFFLTSSNAQHKKFKCIADDYSNTLGSDENWNRLVNDACLAINNERYSEGLDLLSQAIRLDSASNREPSAFIEKEHRKLKRYIENQKTAIVSSENKAEEKKEIVKTEIPEVKAEPKKKKSRKEKKNEKPETKTEEKVEKIADDPAKEINAQQNESTAVNNSNAADSLKNEEKKTEQVKAEPGTVTSAPEEKKEPGANSDILNLDEVEKKEFQEKGKIKIRQLETYLVTIASKNSSIYLSNTAIENAVALFDREDRMVEVSSVNNSNTSKRVVRKYLEKIQSLSYKEVLIEWADFSYASDFILGDDNLYHASVTFQQRFTGLLDNNVVYTDLTTKRIEIILKHFKKAIGGIEKNYWDVFLGDISVLHTQP